MNIIASIVAVAKNNVIGKDNKLIWRLPADMKYFKDMTEGCVVITGRKNYESIPEKFRPLPNRINIVVTRQKDYKAEGAFICSSIEEAIDLAQKTGDKGKRIFIIGGAEIYKQTMDIVDEIFITEIHHEFEGDAFFPEVDKKKWKETSRTINKADEKNKYDYDYCVYERIKDEQAVYKLHFDCGRQGSLNGLFIANKSYIKKLIETSNENSSEYHFGCIHIIIKIFRNSKFISNSIRKA